MKNIILFCLFLIISSREIPAQGYIPEIDSLVTRAMEEFHIPAVSLAIIRDGEIQMIQSYGMANPEYNVPNTNITAFQLASVTKLISATALMTLVQDEKLDLQQKVRHYLPGLPQTWDNMKVIDLVAHQSGITDLMALKINFPSLQSALDTATARPLDFEPGSKTVYAGGDYAVVMKLIESISGMEFQEFLQKSLLEKLDMDHTVFNNMEQDYIYRFCDIIPYATTVYKWEERQNKQRIFSMMFPSWTYTSGGLFSSVSDLAKWVVALDKNTLLKPEFSEMMWTPARLTNGQNSPFGVGWIVDTHNGEKATGHSGGPALADIVRLPDKKITVIFLTNQLELRPFLAMRVLDLYLNKE